MLLGNEVGEFWALRDVSFEVSRCEALGIIERKGTGKGPLLRMLGRITGPTRGRVLLRGRVVSLLEVITGFHHELTGRENYGSTPGNATLVSHSCALAWRSYRSGGRKPTSL